MSIWSEIRPPAHPEWRSTPFRVRANKLLRWLLLALPLISALTAVSIGLAILADQRTEAPIVYVSRGTVAPPSNSRAPLIDINTASAAELATLPGVGDRRAMAIVELRGQRPFTSLADLVERGLLRPAEVMAIGNLATVYVSSR